MRPDLTVSIISAGNLELLLPCLRSVFESTHRVSLEVYLVDNASTGGTAAAVEAGFPQVQVLRNEELQGFATNNNRVLRRGRGRYLMLLNDDTLVLPGAFDRMVQFMDGHPDAGAVGSSCLNPDLSYQQSFSDFPSPWYEGWWTSVDWLYRVRKKGPQEPKEVDCVSGACMMVRREVARQVGLLDTAFDPIYAEETDWLFRIKKGGWKVYTLPGARVIHYGGETMNRTPLRKIELLQAHKALFFRKHHGPHAAWFFKVSLMVASALKAMAWLVLMPLKGGTARAKFKAHWHLAKKALVL
jgi:hypothetical protein